HGGEYDVACLKRDFELSLTNLFDTQQAARFLGWSRTGYAAVVEAVCGVELAKAHTQHDWGRRPIDALALGYALDDVVHLPEVGAELLAQIEAADLREELELANKSVAEAEAHDNRFEPARMWKLDGANTLRGDRLALLAALYAWRDQKGRELDRPPGRLIANEPLMQLARKAPRDAPSLGRVRLRRSFAVSHGEELLALIDRALREPPGIPPKPRKPKRAPAERARHRALQAWRREEADRRQLPQQVVLPKQALDWLAREGADDLVACPQLGPGRIGRYGSILQRLCPRNSEVRESQ
ncbi:MAG: HRDC domain-containing protein, partial [Myxococcales bacterium]|nr:HRDC domain-containing protein [Myxococcales bacterium]